MNLSGKVVVVTGGAHGIGRSLCRRFAAEGVRGLVVGDLDEQTAAETGGLAVRTDVSLESDVQRLVERAREAFGEIDLFCSNAGIFVGGGEEVADADWERIWSINVKAHIYAARAVLPSMLARGEGYLLQTVSAAGLLSQVGSAPYAVTKHGALAFAEWLAITYGDRGIKVSCLCPQGVRTAMLPSDSFLAAGALEPESVADAVVTGLAAEGFLILPHPEVADYFQRKASDYDRWLGGMRRLRARVEA
ncbi:MAG: SDR family NAD(P)-dependent oxidoreductase [Acidobacteria bacterium]|nr:SDR family NAD(P)-dependent oxidoreductase [Acidobacteriota bacterium]